MWRCFNEAPANSPGNARSTLVGGVDGIDAYCFNEAPANSPGNGRLRGRSLLRARCFLGFNEAPANSPGNGSPCVLVSTILTDVALLQ